MALSTHLRTAADELDREKARAMEILRGTPGRVRVKGPEPHRPPVAGRGCPRCHGSREAMYHSALRQAQDGRPGGVDPHDWATLTPGPSPMPGRGESEDGPGEADLARERASARARLAELLREMNELVMGAFDAGEAVGDE